MKFMGYIWPIVGLAAVGFSSWLLYHELRDISFDDVIGSLEAIPSHRWILAAGGAIAAYAALAGYDRIALMHLNRRIRWLFVAISSFTAYALSHNIGASMISGAVVRYRAYTSRGLTGAEVGVLVAMCSLTFALGMILLSAIVLLIDPELVARFVGDLPAGVQRAAGIAMLAFVLLYVFGSWWHLRSFRIGSFELHYPKLPIVACQLVIGPLELIGAAAIIYFTLPETGNPGFLVVLGIFLVSFGMALLSHAPGGLGVLEVVFLTGLPDMDEADVLAALIVFRFYYLLIPFAISLVVVLLFERSAIRSPVAGTTECAAQLRSPPETGAYSSRFGRRGFHCASA